MYRKDWNREVRGQGEKEREDYRGEITCLRPTPWASGALRLSQPSRKAVQAS